MHIMYRTLINVVWINQILESDFLPCLCLLQVVVVLVIAASFAGGIAVGHFAIQGDFTSRGMLHANTC